MKKFIFLFSVMLMFIALPIVLAAQSTGDPPTAENPISLSMFASITALAAGVVALTAFVKNALNTTGFITDIVSWILGPVLALIGWYFKFGLFEGLLWYVAIFYGLIAAFYANKGWDLFSVIAGKKNINYR